MILLWVHLSEHRWTSFTIKCMSHFLLKMFPSWLYQNKVFWRVSQGGKAPLHCPPGSREGEEQNTATGQHKKPFHSWLATEGEPHIKAPWFQHYNKELEWNRSSGKISAGNWRQSEEWSAISQSILANGKIEARRKMSHHFDEDVISDLLQLKTKLTSTSLERKPRISFRLIWSLREKIAIQLKTEQKP